MTNFTDEAMQLAAREAAEKSAREAADRAAREASERAAREAGQAFDSQVAGLIGNARKSNQFGQLPSSQEAGLLGFRDPKNFQRIPTPADARRELGEGAARMKARRSNHPDIFQSIPPPPTDPRHPDFFKIKVIPLEATRTGDAKLDRALTRSVDDGMSPLIDEKTFKERMAANLGEDLSDARFDKYFGKAETVAAETFDTGTMKRAALEIVNTPEAMEQAARRLDLDRAQFMPRPEERSLGSSFNFLQTKALGSHGQMLQDAAKRSARELQDSMDFGEMSEQIKKAFKETDEVIKSRSIFQKISDNVGTVAGIAAFSTMTTIIAGATWVFIAFFIVNKEDSSAENFMMYHRENLEQFPNNLRFATPEEVEQNVRALFQTVDQGIIEPNELVFLLNQLFVEARQLNISLTPEFEDEVKDMTKELFEIEANKAAILEGRVLLSDIVEPVDPNDYESPKSWYVTPGGMTMIGLGVFALVMILVFVFFML